MVEDGDAGWFAGRRLDGVIAPAGLGIVKFPVVSISFTVSDLRVFCIVFEANGQACVAAPGDAARLAEYRCAFEDGVFVFGGEGAFPVDVVGAFFVGGADFEQSFFRKDGRFSARMVADVDFGLGAFVGMCYYFDFCDFVSPVGEVRDFVLFPVVEPVDDSTYREVSASSQV